MNYKKITNLIFVAILFCGFNFTVSAQPIEIIFTAATDTLTRAEVNAKLSEYDSDELEANGFIAIIADGITVIEGSFEGEAAFIGNQNIVKVVASTVTAIGRDAFYSCTNLISVDLPLVTTINIWAFDNCISLETVNFPLATTIKNESFGRCISLTSINFGTGFETETEIKFNMNVFFNAKTENVDLTLGENVLPLPDLDAMTWQDSIGNGTGAPYVWKNITIQKVSIEETIKNRIVNIYPNPTRAAFTVSFDLEKSCNVQIILSDIQGEEIMQIYDGFATVGNFIEKVNTENLTSGIYFLKIFIDGKYTVEKIVVN